MKYITSLFLVGVNLFMSCSSAGQIKSIVKKTYSFATERQPGNIPVDVNGNEILVEMEPGIQVYVETTNKNITWDSAWFNGKTYLLVMQNVGQQNTDAGRIKMTGKNAVIKIAPGNYLWQLSLFPLETIQPAVKKSVLKLGINSVIISGKYKGIAFLQKAGVPAQLEAIPSM